MIRGVEIGAGAEEFFRSRRLGATRGRLRLLALTYEFDPRSFERAFANILRWPVRVDVVTGKPVHLPRVADQMANSSLRIWRARWKGTFHPKMVLMLSRDEVAVGLGSANLTSAGLGERLEVWRYFTNADSAELLAGVRSFLSLLLDRKILPPEVNAEEFIQALPRQKGTLIPIKSTMHGRLLDQVVNAIPRRVTRVDIISPVEGTPAPVIAELKSRVEGKPEIYLYSNDPLPVVQGVSAYRKLVRPRNDSQKAADKLRVLSTVHAKVFAFHSSNYVDVFWGSANLSQPAWLARGSGANVDFLVHTRVRSKQWERFRDGLPPEHTWVAAKPARASVKPEPRELGGLHLLHATLSKSTVNLVATDTGSVIVWLRTAYGRTKCELDFADQGMEVRATLSHDCATKLGLLAGNPPRLIDAKLPKTTWERIPLNDLDAVPGDTEARKLEDMLLWEYAGRTFRRNGGGKKRTSADKGDGTTSLDEEELAKFAYQGALDEFVLNWRVIAKRIAVSSGANANLMEVRVRDTLDRISRDVEANPETWPQYKRNFVEQLLERLCRA